MERRLRTDLIIALVAVLISAIAAAAAAYQTYVINQQFSATVWPYLALDDTYGTGGIKVVLENDGLGPAIVRSAALNIDGRAAYRWSDVVAQVPRPHGSHLAGLTASLGNGEVIRAGDARTLLDLHGTLAGATTVLRFERQHRVSLDVCYCSILAQCWIAHLLTQNSNPQKTPACATATSIEGA